MSRGNGQTLAQIDPLTWMSGVRVGEHGNSQSNSGSRERSSSKPKEEAGPLRRKSSSQTRDGVGDEKDGQQSLQDEYVRAVPVAVYACLNARSRITSVLNKLSAFKIKLEKVVIGL